MPLTANGLFFRLQLTYAYVGIPEGPTKVTLQTSEDFRGRKLPERD